MTALSGGQNKRKRSILLVSNKSRETFTISLLLQRFDYDVLISQTAALALERVAAKVPDLIISDLVLPGLAGMDLLYMLRMEKQSAAVPLVFLLPHNTADTKSQCIDKGAAAVLALPVQAEELYRTVQTVLEPVPRIHIRIETCLAARINDEPVDADDGKCRIELSEQGMFVPARKRYSRDDRVAIEFTLDERTITAECSVLYTILPSGTQAKSPGVGLKFINIASDDQEAIRKYIRHEVTQRTGKE